MKGMPFIFCHNDQEGTDSFVVIKSTCKAWFLYDTSWMGEPWLNNSASSGGRCFIPMVDLKDEAWVFRTEKEALRKMKELWSLVDVEGL